MQSDSGPQIEILGPVHGPDVPADWQPLIERARPIDTYSNSMAWFAAKVDDKIVAIGGLKMNWSYLTDWLGPSLVDESSRGRGIQKKLIEARLKYAEARRQSVKSAADITNTASLRNMLNAGFRVQAYDPKHRHLELAWSNK